VSLRLRVLAEKRELTMLDVRNPVVTGEGMTRQEFKAECDINNIMRRYARDAFLTHVSGAEPRYLDVSEVTDFRTAIEQVRAAEEYFEGLPAKVRAKFGNDPVRYLDEAGSLSRKELMELGLAELRKDEPPPKRRAADVAIEKIEDAT